MGKKKPDEDYVTITITGKLLQYISQEIKLRTTDIIMIPTGQVLLSLQVMISAIGFF